MDVNNSKKERTGFPSVDRPWMKFYNTEWYQTKVSDCTVYENIIAKK